MKIKKEITKDIFLQYLFNGDFSINLNNGLSMQVSNIQWHYYPSYLFNINKVIVKVNISKSDIEDTSLIKYKSLHSSGNVYEEVPLSLLVKIIENNSGLKIK